MNQRYHQALLASILLGGYACGVSKSETSFSGSTKVKAAKASQDQAGQTTDDELISQVRPSDYKPKDLAAEVNPLPHNPAHPSGGSVQHEALSQDGMGSDQSEGSGSVAEEVSAPLVCETLTVDMWDKSEGIVRFSMPPAVLTITQERLAESLTPDEVQKWIHVQEKVGKTEVRIALNRQLSEAASFDVVAKDSLGKTAICHVSIKPQDGLGEADDQVTKALTARVYQLHAQTQKLPDLKACTTYQSQLMSFDFNVPKRSFEEGFPGVPDLFEWFGIYFVGTITLPTTGDYSFRLGSDDGSKLWIQDMQTPLIDNDQLHPFTTKVARKEFEAGTYAFELQYFQGPRTEIGLVLEVSVDGGDYVLVPPSWFARPEQMPEQILAPGVEAACTYE